MTQDLTEKPLPTLAYFMTDVVGSTRLWEKRPAEMATAIASLDKACDECVRRAHGTLVRGRGEGDSHFAVFHSADDAIAAAIALLIRIKEESALTEIEVRAGINIGTADLWAGDYYGSVVNRCARIRQVARPGQILVSEAVHAIVAANRSMDFKDLGVHRLRDLMQPERLFQVVHPDLERDFPPPETLSELSHNLPSYLSSFVGRVTELAELTQIIEANRLTTVTGAGGSGKTRLTQQVAAERVENFKDGAWFIDFAQTDRSASVLPILCHELDPAMEASEAQLLETLAHREMLLILDNCEHLIEECRGIAQTLLRSCPGLRILATSRRSLEVRGEYVYKLGGLRLPEPGELVDAPQYDGFRLFVERAKQHGTVLPIDDSSIPGIVELCRKLDGLPLAIEMAAGLTDVLSIGEISKSIAECLEVGDGYAGEDSRQRTISATIDWSIRLLSPDAQTLLERVSFFPNTWTLEAACAVCFPEMPRTNVRELLRELISHSLVFTTRTAVGDLRFGLLQTTRELVSGRAGTQDHLASNYVAYCKGIIVSLQNQAESGNEAAAHELVDLEYETLIKALDISIETDPAACAEIALALRRYWMSGNRLPEGAEWYERLLNSSQLSREARVSVQIALSSLYILLGENESAITILERAEETVRPLGGLEMAKVIGNLAVLRDRLGQYREAKEGFEQCCVLMREFESKRGLALSLLNLGVVKMRLEEPLAECSALFNEALECAKGEKYVALEAKTHSCLAHVALKEGRFVGGLASCRQALILWLSDTVVPDSNLALLDVADLFVALNRFHAAAAAIHIAERLEQLSQSPLPSLHQERLSALRNVARPRVPLAEWRSGQRLTRSKSVQELTTMAILLIESESDLANSPVG